MARKGNPISVRLDLNRSSDSSWFSEGDRSLLNGSTRHESILEGRPIHEIFPDTDLSSIVDHPFFCPSTVHIPGEILDLSTIASLTRFNHFLTNMRYDFFDGVIYASYIRSLQHELTQTPKELLFSQLNFMFAREYTHLCNWYNSCYFHTFGVECPSIYVNYAQWCHYWSMKALDGESLSRLVDQIYFLF